MYPLPPHTVELVLQYISPLTDPIPPHLISAPLRQRHHFLQISTSSPVDYLCWPSPDSAKIIGLLDRLPPLSGQASYPTRYTSDPESTFAHVQISSNAQGLCMLFHWDNTHAWKYHDLRLMPFPSPSFSSPQESLTGNSTSRAGPPLHSSLHLVSGADQIDSDSEDSYWDSYGATAHDLSSPSQNASEPDLVGEDAYWAQYTSIQGCQYLMQHFPDPNSSNSLGSADSTVPSPLPVDRKLRPVYPNDDESVFSLPPQHDPIIDVPVDVIHSRTQPGPPSPNMLANLLSTISPRKDIHIDDPYPSQSPTDPSPEQTTADSELVTPPFPDEYLDTAVVSPVAVKVNGVPASKCHPFPPRETEDKALTESIQGLYYLWKSARKGEPDPGDKSVFLRIVREAVAHE